MLHGLKLLLPALIPSWRFFDTIAPSPRIEYALLHDPHAAAAWREFRPRPARPDAAAHGLEPALERIPLFGELRGTADGEPYRT